MSIINYFFEKHIERCKKELENFENNKFKEVREDLRVETRKYIEEINNFLRSINAESFTDFNGFNSKIKTFNDELNRIMKASANISTLVYVIQNVSEDDFYTYTDFISSFSYDENKFNNASERDIKYLKLLDKYLQKINDDFEVYKERGDLKAELGFYNEAIDDYKKALELNPNYEEAKKCSERILEFDNNNPESYFVQGFVKQNLGQYEEAIKNFYKAIELNPNYSLAYYNIGITKYNLKQYEEAIKNYNKAIKLTPNDSHIYNVRGLAKEKLKQYKEAFQDYKKALELDPNNGYAKNSIKNIQEIYSFN